MEKLTCTMYQIDAFTDRVFGGNPAAVCLMEHWPEDQIMQQIALENNLSETAFAVRQGDAYLIRWFTPKAEVALCGHATLATAWCIFHKTTHVGNRILFDTLYSGRLEVERSGTWLVLNFPADHLKRESVDPTLQNAFSVPIIEQYTGNTDVLLVTENEESVLSCQPDHTQLKKLNHRGFVLTAPGKSVDFVSRCFYPALGIEEDPVTGSAHTSLAVYWKQRLGKDRFEARQLSERGGHLLVSLSGDRVFISGQAVIFMEATLQL